MRDVFDQDRPMTLGAVKMATAILGIALAAAAVLILIGVIITLFKGKLLIALTQLVLGFAGLIFLFVTVRLLGEILAALHRLNDRLAILGDDIRNPRRVAGAPGDKAEG
ncbi:hypothetical protein [Hyphomonas johnsonii]|uniref:Uncharacterized protein n=1 Tax=Hyphomonas johnsonii MHS-2 TaxID=1280950 RepID=A0A059FMJ9_9PROT|nr:hypothetical protein [Hyphomonas johnsonii]KCZ91869.1 hypothetical protein HJO_12147 [Hyphomonas johnsonii MHS-2]